MSTTALTMCGPWRGHLNQLAATGGPDGKLPGPLRPAARTVPARCPGDPLPEPGFHQRGQLSDVALGEVGQRPFQVDQTGSTGFSSLAYGGSQKTVS